MKIKVANLAGPALNAMVAKANGANLPALLQLSARVPGSAPGQFLIDYSTDLERVGPIVDQERINLRASGASDWTASTHDLPHPEQIVQHGDTLSIAVMRCYVAKKLGDTVEVPDELCLYPPTYSFTESTSTK